MIAPGRWRWPPILALTDQVVERAQRFLEGRVAVVPVRLIEIDEVGLQAPQRILDGLDDVLAREPRVVRGRGPLAPSPWSR